jgi:hypothetical protein
MLAAYGDVIIGTMGTGNPTVKSTGGNFSALAGAPNASIICTQSNAVLLFNTATAANAWATSDIGDYTNWATGEAASGTLYQTPGAITAAVPFGNDVIVFKENAIYRMRYVGGVVKWTVELLLNGIGCISLYGVCPGRNGILFYYQAEFVAQKTTNPTFHLYWFDGVSYPRQINSLTALNPANTVTFITYDPRSDLFAVNTTNTSAPFNRTYFYCPTTDAWGKNTTPITDAQTTRGIPVSGDFAARPTAERSPQPVIYNKENANKLKRYSHGTPIGEIASSCYLETQKIGKAGRKTQFSRAKPVVRRRVDLGTDSSTATLTLFRNLEDTSATTTRSGIVESTDEKRFDLQNGANTDCFGRVKVTWNALDVAVEDILVEAKDVGVS